LKKTSNLSNAGVMGDSICAVYSWELLYNVQ